MTSTTCRDFEFKETYQYFPSAAGKSTSFVRCTEAKRPFGKCLSRKRGQIRKIPLEISALSHLQDVFVSEAVSRDLAFAHVVEPVEFASGM
jgi:hypothetical protein